MSGLVEHDVLIVGGGTAGCVLAARLSEDPGRRVALVEAGRDVRSASELPAMLPRLNADQPRHAAADIWSYSVRLIDGDPRTARQYRGRTLGGSSAINGSLFMRGVPEDYDAWGSGLWRFDRILPYFKRIENDHDFHDEYHGEAGPFDVSRGRAAPLGGFQQRFYEGALRAGVREKADLNHPDGDGIGYMPLCTEGKARTCTALAYLRDCRERPNLAVLTDSEVRRIVFEGTRAVGVELNGADGPRVVRAREVVLSAGTFGSPHLLLRSGVGPADEVRASGVAAVADVPGVGRGMSCHPSIVVRVPADQPADDPGSPRVALVRSSGAAERNDVTLFPRVMRGEGTVLVTLRHPASSGAACLDPAGPDAPPEIRYGYLQPGDLERLRAGVALSLEILGRAATDELSDGWILERLQTSDHACGTCRLGPASDPAAVVDEHCRVRGVDGLRVVDLSIVPRSVRAGPYATVVMLAERAADLVRDAAR